MWHWFSKFFERRTPDPATFTRCGTPYLQMMAAGKMNNRRQPTPSQLDLPFDENGDSHAHEH